MIKLIEFCAPDSEITNKKEKSSYTLYAAECLLTCIYDPNLIIEYEKNKSGENATPLKIVNLSCDR